MKILLIFMNEDGRKGLEFPQQREKHRYTFGHPAGQSSWSCQIIFASLRNEVRRVRHDHNVHLLIYTLFHLPVYITEKKNDRRLFPFSEICHSDKLCICTLPNCDLPRITLTAVSAALLPLLPSWYLYLVFASLPSFAQVCHRPCLLGQVPLSSSVFFNPLGLSKAWRGAHYTYWF